MTSPFRTIYPEPLADAEYAVLGLLSYREASGYDLNKTAERNVDLILAPAKSRIYAVLPRLLARGYVTRRDVAQERRPDKQVYRATPEGRRALRAWLNDTSSSPTLTQLLLKLFFGRWADPAALMEQLTLHRAENERKLALFDDIEETNLDNPYGFFNNLTVWCGQAYAQASLDWAERTLSALREHEQEVRKGRRQRIRG